MRWGRVFRRWLDEDWAQAPLEDLALKYDTVESHGWYDNLDITADQLAQDMAPGEVLIDYSGGTGILTQRLLERCEEPEFSVVIADSSPKFLRLALEKFRHHPAVAYRLIRYLKHERRLQALDECARWETLPEKPAALVSTNAIHLYYDLEDTIRSWHRVLGDDARLYVQSGNIRNPKAGKNTWIIDETVDHIHRAAMEIVRECDEYQDFRVHLDKADYMASHDRLRAKYFLPVRDLSAYENAIESAGFTIRDVRCASIEAQVEDWFGFLSVYHEGVLGWVGGAQRVTGIETPKEIIERRLALIHRCMDHIFEGRATFLANWTYIQAVRGT